MVEEEVGSFGTILTSRPITDYARVVPVQEVKTIRSGLVVDFEELDRPTNAEGTFEGNDLF